jgi:hypothetical protein
MFQPQPTYLLKSRRSSLREMATSILQLDHQDQPLTLTSLPLVWCVLDNLRPPGKVLELTLLSHRL